VIECPVIITLHEDAFYLSFELIHHLTVESPYLGLHLEFLLKGSNY